jgi:hypothetical protein
VTGEVKFAGVNPVVAAMGEFCVAVIACVAGDIAATAGSNTVMLITEVAVRAGVEESVAVMVKTVLANVTVGVPVITPVVESSDKPLGRDGAIVYVSVPVNPVGVNGDVASIATSFVALRFCGLGDSEAEGAAATVTRPRTADPTEFTFAELVAITSTK